jgi:lipoate-protein ligase A
MLCILSTNHDIFFNLAAEEYFLKNSTEEICMLWQSDDSVVVGKHQNAMAEINYLWTIKNNVPIARRLTGGGTVFHGPGNLNFTFIRNGEPGKLVDFKRFVTPIIHYLHSIGIQAKAGGRNDIIVNKLKISGNAEHVYKTRVLHHGTLLFSADLNKLNESIKAKKEYYKDKAVQSVRSQVTNIKSLIHTEMTLKNFQTRLFTYLQDYYSADAGYELTSADIQEINELRNNKYITQKWIYGYSPPFEFSKTIEWQGSQVKIWMKIVKGCIREILLESETENKTLQKIEEQLIGCEYLLSSIQNKILQIISDNEKSMELSEMCF